MDQPLRYEMRIYWSKSDDCFIVEVPELPGCTADGVTYQQAVANAQEVIGVWIKAARHFGMSVPQPREREAFA